MTTTPVFLEQLAYNRLINTLMKPDFYGNGHRDPGLISLALGEFGEIWPEHIRADYIPEIEAPVTNSTNS